MFQIGKFACDADVSGVLTRLLTPLSGASIPADVSCTYLLLICLQYTIAGIPSVAKNSAGASFGRDVLAASAAAAC